MSTSNVIPDPDWKPDFEEEDKGYQVFSNFMDAAFELAFELQERDEEDLTEKEIEFLDTIDTYVENAIEEEE